MSLSTRPNSTALIANMVKPPKIDWSTEATISTSLTAYETWANTSSALTNAHKNVLKKVIFYVKNNIAGNNTPVASNSFSFTNLLSSTVNDLNTMVRSQTRNKDRFIICANILSQTALPPLAFLKYTKNLLGNISELRSSLRDNTLIPVNADLNALMIASGKVGDTQRAAFGALLAYIAFSIVAGEFPLRKELGYILLVGALIVGLMLPKQVTEWRINNELDQKFALARALELNMDINDIAATPIDDGLHDWVETLGNVGRQGAMLANSIMDGLNGGTQRNRTRPSTATIELVDENEAKQPASSSLRQRHS